ncbi:hypothetical protein JCM3765_001069 [Sporobolomyces pararoseus]
MDDSQLVRELTEKLETLQHEKQRLERAIEGQADSIALKLRLALLAAGQGTRSSSNGRLEPHRHSHQSGSTGRRRNLSSTSPSSSISASSTTSTSSSTSFPSSPSPLLSPLLANASASLQQPPSPDVIAALRENSELRVRLANTERVNQYYQREIADLRRICGVSIDELEELDPRPSHSYSSVGGGSRRRSISSRSNGGATVGSIRIPGAPTSVSPPSIRPSTSSYPSNAPVPPYSSSYSYNPHSLSSYPRFLPHSYTSSINTTMTTPSSSFPIANPPAPTPSTSLDFAAGQVGDQTLVLPPPSPTSLLSPDSTASSSSSSFYGSSRQPFPLSPLPAPPLQIAESSNRRSSSGLELEDLAETSPSLLPTTADTPTKLTVITSLDSASSDRRGSRKGKETSRKSIGGNANGKPKNGVSTSARSQPQSLFNQAGPSTSTTTVEGNVGEEEEEEDPLVLAVTNSLKKLIAQNEESGNGGEEGTIRRRIRRFSNELDDEEVSEEPEEIEERVSRGKGRSASFGEIIEEETGDDDDDYTTEEEDDDDGSSTTSREEDKYEQLRAEITRLQRQVQMGQQQQRPPLNAEAEEDDEDEEEYEDEDGTPLSVSPGSRGRSRRQSSASHH